MDFSNILSFLVRLTENNNRGWFDEHKAEYTQLKEEFEHFIQQLIPKVKEIDPSIGLIEAKDCVFRIYRDVRFSKNKAPYKNHFGAYISNSGRKSKFAGYYIHIQPGESFIAAGAYNPEPEILKEIRYEILDNVKSFKNIIGTSEFKKYFNKITGESLKTAPKGFPKDFEEIELLKFKSFEVAHKLEEKILQSPDNEAYILQIMRIAQPYNSFFNKVIAHKINEAQLGI